MSGATVTVTENVSSVDVTISESPVLVGLASSTLHNTLIGRSVATAHPASAITNTPAGNIAATTVQAAIDELDAEKQPLDADLTGLASDYDAATKTLTYNTSKAATSAGGTLQSNSATLCLTWGAGGGANVTTADGLNVTGALGVTGAATVTNASGITTLQSATQDAIRLLGRAGGTSSYVATLTPTTLTASRTYTFPDATGTVPLLGLAQTFTAINTFSSATASTSTSTGAVVISAGGLGVAGAIYGGGILALTTTTGERISLGAKSSLSTADPVKIDLGGSFSSSAGSATNTKLRLFNNSSGIYGFGVSSLQLEYHSDSSNTGARHVFYAGAAEQMRISGTTGVSISATTASTSTTTGALTVAGGGAFAKELVTGLGLWLVDGQTAPSSTSGYAKIYVDTADGDLKIIFGDGTIKTIVTDT